ncbi:hypothetical protein [Ideonella sp. B508-1]|nr:hypothetical protein [Ideonella sp. B508-1]
MNILYLNHYAGTPALGMEYRPYYLAPRFGCNRGSHAELRTHSCRRSQ